MMSQLKNGTKWGMVLRPRITSSTNLNFSSDKLTVKHDNTNEKFSIAINSDKAYIEYKKQGDTIILKETQVPSVLQGKGVGKILAEEAFKYVATNNYNMVIECTYLQHHLNKHSPEYKKYLARL